jgi:hypothetical protein
LEDQGGTDLMKSMVVVATRRGCGQVLLLLLQLLDPKGASASAHQSALVS